MSWVLSKKPSPTSQMTEYWYTNNLPNNISDTALSKAQIAHDRTEMELMWEQSNDTELTHDEGSFLSKRHCLISPVPSKIQFRNPIYLLK
jgi:hypothetical protein